MLTNLRLHRRLILGLLVFVSSALAQPPQKPGELRELTLAVEQDWYPYAGVEDGKAVGMSVDIVRAAYVAVGVTANFRPMPFPRCLAEAQRGAELACFNVATEGEHLNAGKLLLNQTPLFTVIPGIYVQAQSALAALDGETLSHLRVAIPKGGDYGIAIESNKRILREEVLSELAGLRMLLRGRVDAALVDPRSFAHLVRSHPQEFGGQFKNAINASNFLPGPGHVAFSAARPEARRMAELLDKGLAAIEASGEYGRIMRRWESSEAMVAR